MKDVFFQDLRYGVRSLFHTPTFAAIAIGTLGLGIGAAVGIFTLVNAVLLRPLPIPGPDHVGIIRAATARGRTGGPFASWTKYELLRDQTNVFSEVGAYVERALTIDLGSGPVRVRGSRVTASLFDVLGVEPALGRSFAPQDDVEGAAPVAIMSDAFWKDQFNADPSVVGRTIRVEARDTPVIGILPAGFRLNFGNDEPQLYLTSVFTPDIMTAVQIHSGAGFLTYIGRLRAGASFEQARAELAELDAQYAKEHGNYVDATLFVLQLDPLLESLVGSVRPALRISLGAVLFLLLVACANVAHLLLERATARRREVAIRLAMGASQWRLTRQFLTESLLITVGGCIAGLIIARVVVTLLIAHGPDNIPRLADVAPDSRVLIFATAIGSLTALLFGVLPSLRIRSADVAESLRFGRTGGIGTRHSFGMQQWITGSQTAVTVVLLIGAILLFRSLLSLESVDPGFDPRKVTTAQITLQQNKYVEEYQREAFFTHLLHGLQAQSGLASVGATSYLPMAGADYGFFFFIEGQPHLGVGRDRAINVRHVSPDFFRTMHISLQRGRTFSDTDSAQSQPVAIINEAAARAYFPNSDPLGQHLANSRDSIMREIVGIVGNEHFSGAAHGYTPELFLPYRQVPPPAMTVVVSSTLPVDAVANAIRQNVQQIDKDQAIGEVRPMENVVAATMRQQRFMSSLLGTFAGAATALAAIGVYGVVSMFVGQRRQEFGVRIALGAQQSDVLQHVMRQGGRLISIGIVIGMIAALGVSRLLSSLLFGVSSTEPLSYAIAVAILFVSGLLACYLPARRATKIDPADCLRSE